MTLAGACAIFASILAGYAALDLLPPTVAGRTGAFAIWLVAVYPADRLMASTKERPWWHHWAGSGVGVIGVWIAYTLMERGIISDQMSLMLSLFVGAFVVGSLVYYALKPGRHERSP